MNLKCGDVWCFESSFSFSAVNTVRFVHTAAEFGVGGEEISNKRQFHHGRSRKRRISSSSLSSPVSGSYRKLMIGPQRWEPFSTNPTDSWECLFDGVSISIEIQQLTIRFKESSCQLPVCTQITLSVQELKNPQEQWSILQVKAATFLRGIYQLQDTKEEPLYLRRSWTFQSGLFLVDLCGLSFRALLSDHYCIRVIGITHTAQYVVGFPHEWDRILPRGV